MKFLLVLLFIFSLQIVNAQPSVQSIDTKDACQMIGPINEAMYESLKGCKSDKVIIYSGGGEYQAGIKIAKLLDGKTMFCYQCQSMAAIIFSKNSGKRYIKKDAIIMFHQAYTQCNGYGGPETAKDLRKVADELDKLNLSVSRGFKGITSKQYLKMIEHMDWYPSLTEIKKYKLADGVFDARK